MSLTAGSGPFGERPAGTLVPELPTDAPFLLWEPVPYRVSATFAAETVVATLGAKLLHERGRLPVFWIPEADVRVDLLAPSETVAHCPHLGDACFWHLRAGGREERDAVRAIPEPLPTASFLRGHVAPRWEAFDEWFGEDEQLFGHPRDPYSRIDVLPTSRHVVVRRDGVVLAESRRARLLVETGLPPRWYLPPEDVRTDLLVPSARRSRCAYKGSAAYWSVRVGDRLVPDLVWSYPAPQHDAEPVRGLLCFFDERVDVEVEGVAAPRPRTQWTRDDDG